MQKKLKCPVPKKLQPRISIQNYAAQIPVKGYNNDATNHEYMYAH